MGRAGNQRTRADAPSEVVIGVRPIVRRHQHHRDARKCRVGAQQQAELEAVGVSHEHIAQHDVRPRLGCALERLSNARGRRHDEAKA
jgi:hypothetical protein